MTENVKRWVRVWFPPIGELDTQPTLLANYRADEDAAERYRDAMQENFAGLLVSVDPLPNPPPVRDLPAEQLWRLAPC
jgi:hypothetical protein